MSGKWIKGLFFFCIAVAILIASLKVMNWLPSAAQKGYMSEYPDIDSVRTKLKIGDIYVPKYFPQQIKWPPSSIRAQTRPFPAVITEYRNSVTRERDLIITQSARPARVLRAGKPIITQVKEKTHYDLKGRSAVLEVGPGDEYERCSRLSWQEGKYFVTVELKAPPFELIRISESMLRR